MNGDHLTGDGPTSRDPVLICERVLRDFINDPGRNNLGPGAPDPAWEDFLLGFAAGDDPLWQELKTAVGPEHWTPAEAFNAAREEGIRSVGAPNPKQPTTSWAAMPIDPAGRDTSDSTPAPVAPDEVTVVTWTVVQTEATKASNRAESRMPSERWARARVFGQMANRELHRALLEELWAAGYEAVAPAMLPAWGEIAPGTDGWRSTWSERHVAYVGGLGTFGLAGGLITRRGQAVRFGSVIVRAVIPVTPRPYSDPFAYCLHFSGHGCAACAERCPVGSVSPQGRDKTACVGQLDRAENYVRQTYGFEGYGCGLCQTGVPCESGIPAGLG